jgi:alpha-L-arabinofuranosidase
MKDIFNYEAERPFAKYLLQEAWRSESAQWMNDRDELFSLESINGGAYGDYEVRWVVKPGTTNKGDLAAIEHFRLRPKPDLKGRITEKLMAARAQYLLKQEAINDLTMAVADVRHHKRPNRTNVKDALEKRFPDKWHCWVDKPSDEWSQWQWHVQGNGIKSNDKVMVYAGKDAEMSWATLFEGLRKQDFLPAVADVDRTLKVLDDLIELDGQLRDIMTDYKAKVKELFEEGKSPHYYAMDFLPALKLDVPSPAWQ